MRISHAHALFQNVVCLAYCWQCCRQHWRVAIDRLLMRLMSSANIHRKCHTVSPASEQIAKLNGFCRGRLPGCPAAMYKCNI